MNHTGDVSLNHTYFLDPPAQFIFDFWFGNGAPGSAEPTLMAKASVIDFEHDKMTLRVPVNKAKSTGMRALSSPKKMKTALDTLKGRARVKRTMWSRRAQEYEAKINSGDPVSIAEVVRDLHRNAGQPDQSYSERQIYESAKGRLAREVAAVESINEEEANARLDTLLVA